MHQHASFQECIVNDYCGIFFLFWRDGQVKYLCLLTSGRVTVRTKIYALFCPHQKEHFNICAPLYLLIVESISGAGFYDYCCVPPWFMGGSYLVQWKKWWQILCLLAEDGSFLATNISTPLLHWMLIGAWWPSTQHQMLVWWLETEGRTERSDGCSLRPAGLTLKINGPRWWRFEIALAHINAGP